MGGVTSKDKVMYPLATFINHEDAITCMAVSDDKSLIATGSEDATIRVWGVKDVIDCDGWLRGHKDYITCVTFHGIKVVSGSADNTMRRWNIATCECEFVYNGHEDRITKVICSDEFFFTASVDQTAKAWHFNRTEQITTKENAYDALSFKEEGDSIRTFRGHNKSVLALVFLPELNSVGIDAPGISAGDTLITSSADYTVKTWSLKTGKTIKTFRGHRGPISCMDVKGDRKILFTGSLDRTIRRWNIATGQCLKVMEGHVGPVLCLKFVGKFLYSGDGKGLALCRLEKTGEVAQTYTGHQHSVNALRFNNGLLYTVCGDTCARAFHSGSGDLKYLYKGHTNAVTSLAIIGNKMVTAGAEGTLRAWNCTKPKEVEKEAESDDSENEEEDLAYSEEEEEEEEEDHYINSLRDEERRYSRSELNV